MILCTFHTAKQKKLAYIELSLPSITKVIVFHVEHPKNYHGPNNNKDNKNPNYNGGVSTVSQSMVTYQSHLKSHGNAQSALRNAVNSQVTIV